MLNTGRDIAQPVSCWLPMVAAQVRAKVRSCGICVDKVALVQVDLCGQSGTGAGFLRALRFLANLHSTSCSTITIIYHLGLIQ
jgi:hypothetical protein